MCELRRANDILKAASGSSRPSSTVVRSSSHANGGLWRDWVGWFDDERLHSKLDDTTPSEIEEAYYRDQRQADVA